MLVPELKTIEDVAIMIGGLALFTGFCCITAYLWELRIKYQERTGV